MLWRYTSALTAATSAAIPRVMVVERAEAGIFGGWSVGRAVLRGARDCVVRAGVSLPVDPAGPASRLPRPAPASLQRTHAHAHAHARTRTRTRTRTHLHPHPTPQSPQPTNASKTTHPHLALFPPAATHGTKRCGPVAAPGGRGGGGGGGGGWVRGRGCVGACAHEGMCSAGAGGGCTRASGRRAARQHFHSALSWDNGIRACVTVALVRLGHRDD